MKEGDAKRQNDAVVRAFQKNPRSIYGDFMFTGIITNLGKLQSKQGAVFTFAASPPVCRKISTGTSIAVNGACLTAVRKTRQTFTVEIMPETLRRTGLGKLQTGDLVNLELPATAKTFLSGHIVQGHVDGAGTIKKIVSRGNSRILSISIPKALAKYLADKGSIAVNGISLTIISAKPNYFKVGIIPYTWEHTMLHQIKIGGQVNIEVDLLAKYLEKL